MKIFLDVGGHNGETITIALNPKWGFEAIHSFEPSSHLYRTLRKFRDKRLFIHNLGLGKKSEFKTLYGAGTVGGSIYQNKNFCDKNALNYIEKIELIEASLWIQSNTSPSDLIYLKMNCEGSEADILENLIETNNILRINSIYIDFDVRKIPGQEYRQSLIEENLKSLNINFKTPEMLGTKGAVAIEKWLESSLSKKNVSYFPRTHYKLKLYLPTYLRIKFFILKKFPRTLVVILSKNFGRLQRK